MGQICEKVYERRQHRVIHHPDVNQQGIVLTYQGSSTNPAFYQAGQGNVAINPNAQTYNPMHRGYHIVHRAYHKPYHGPLNMHQGGWSLTNHQPQQIRYPPQPQANHPMPYFSQNQVQHPANPHLAEVIQHEIQRQEYIERRVQYQMHEAELQINYDIHHQQHRELDEGHHQWHHQEQFQFPPNMNNEHHQHHHHEHHRGHQEIQIEVQPIQQLPPAPVQQVQQPPPEQPPQPVQPPPPEPAPQIIVPVVVEEHHEHHHHHHH